MTFKWCLRLKSKDFVLLRPEAHHKLLSNGIIIVMYCSSTKAALSCPGTDVLEREYTMISKVLSSIIFLIKSVFPSSNDYWLLIIELVAVYGGGVIVMHRHSSKVKSAKVVYRGNCTATVLRPCSMPTYVVYHGSIDAMCHSSINAMYRSSISTMYHGNIDAIYRCSINVMYLGSIAAMYCSSLNAMYRGSIDAMYCSSIDAMYRGSIDAMCRSSIKMMTRFYGPIFAILVSRTLICLTTNLRLMYREESRRSTTFYWLPLSPNLGPASSNKPRKLSPCSPTWKRSLNGTTMVKSLSKRVHVRHWNVHS